MDATHPVQRPLPLEKGRRCPRAVLTESAIPSSTWCSRSVRVIPGESLARGLRASSCRWRCGCQAVAALADNKRFKVVAGECLSAVAISDEALRRDGEQHYALSIEAGKTGEEQRRAVSGQTSDKAGTRRREQLAMFSLSQWQKGDLRAHRRRGSGADLAKAVGADNADIADARPPYHALLGGARALRRTAAFRRSRLAR